MKVSDVWTALLSNNRLLAIPLFPPLQPKYYPTFRTAAFATVNVRQKFVVNNNSQITLMDTINSAHKL